MGVKARGSGPHRQLLAQDETLLHPQDHSRGSAGVGESLWDQCNVEAKPRAGSRAEPVAGSHAPPAAAGPHSAGRGVPVLWCGCDGCVKR